jgi:hypothetical protein
MALVSPGIEISVSDQSQFVTNTVGSVPLLVVATAQDKTYNGVLAAGTTKANAGKLQSFTSQRDLVVSMGTPTFRTSSAGTPVHAGELNEYGLLAAYSALGLGNQLYAIRADINLNQLVGTSVRPSSAPNDGTYWLDTDATTYGVFELNRTTNEFEEVDLFVITDPTQVEEDTVTFGTLVHKPKRSVGAMGTYAMVMVTDTDTIPRAIRLWHKTNYDAVSVAAGGPGANQWVLVGDSQWQYHVPAVTGTRANPTITAAGTAFTINGIPVTSTGTSLSSLVGDINATAGLTGVKASISGTKLSLYCTSAADSNQGRIRITDVTTSGGTYNTNTVLGIPAGTYHAPILHKGNYATAPSGGWLGGDTQPRPTGSVWWKLGETGGGLKIVLSEYSAAVGQFESISIPLYLDVPSAINALDPIGGGINISVSQHIATYQPSDSLANGIQIAHYHSTANRGSNGEHIAYTGTPTTFTGGHTFTIRATAPGSSTLSSPVTVTLSGTTAASFVQDIQGSNVPFVTAAVESNGTISITHQTGGVIILKNTTSAPGNPLSNAGFEADALGSPTKGSGYLYNAVQDFYVISPFDTLTHEPYVFFKDSAPTSAPEDGTYWYYSNAADVDVMINDSGWKGYRNVSSDSRGYNLTNTDPNGVIVSATQPTTQSDASTLVAGDLWLDSSDLANYPKLYRYTGTTWAAIDTTDSVTSNGIIFADARWGVNGTVNPVSDSLPSIAGLLLSNYLDLDAPDYRLYPRGALLFNTRRSGYNVKRFVSDYFNETAFDVDPLNTIGLPTALPAQTNAWVSTSGLNNNGTLKAGSAAQRAIVVAAMQSALDSNLEIREDLYQFNLLATPGYPELIDNMVALNTDRGETAFVIGDTPMTLASNGTALTAWNSNSNGTGLATASPYLSVYYPSGLTSDLSGQTVAVPPSHMALRTFIYNDNVSYPWFAPAGTSRGLVNNVSDVGYVNANTGAWVHNSIGQGLRDTLYTLKINPITQLPGVGIVVWGQETKSGTSTSRNRVNVVRLENYLRSAFKTIANGYLFEPNDQITRKSIATQIESALNDVLSKRGVYDFLVVCDSTNNTPSTIANNQLYVDVAIEPARDIEFIYIPIALFNPGALAALGTSST